MILKLACLQLIPCNLSTSFSPLRIIRDTLHMDKQGTHKECCRAGGAESLTNLRYHIEDCAVFEAVIYDRNQCNRSLPDIGHFSIP